MLHPTYPIETPRLLLRPYAPDDLDALYDFQRRDDVTRYLYWGPRTREETRAALEQRLAESTVDKEGDVLSLVLERRDGAGTGGGEVVGTVNLWWLSEQHRQGEIGFTVHPDHHGRGLATEASRELLRLGFEGLRLHRIIGRLDARNAASARVLEKLDMRREAHFVRNEFVKGEWADELVYALLAEEWAAPRPGC